MKFFYTSVFSLNAYLLINCMFIQCNIAVIFFIHIQIFNKAFMQEIFKIPVVKLKNYIGSMVFSYVSAKIELQNAYIERV